MAGRVHARSFESDGLHSANRIVATVKASAPVSRVLKSMYGIRRGRLVGATIPAIEKHRRPTTDLGPS